MKKNKIIALALATMFGVSSCSLDTETYDQKESGSVISTLKDIESGLYGCYYRLGSYYFLGNYAVATGDMCSGISAGSASSGHFNSFSSFSFTDTETELDYIWYGGYNLIANATNYINGADELVENGAIAESELPELYNYLGQLHALKALSAYYLVNYFALPYSEANKSSLGIIVVDKEVPEALAKVSRGTVEETYTQIKNDIAAAEKYMELSEDEAETSAYYMGYMGLEALKARVYMSLGDYTTAKAAALLALDAKGNGSGDADDDVPSDEDYINMWGDTSINGEDLFTIKKSEDDNLSANALNTLYGSYYATIQNTTLNLIGDNDIRAELIRKSSGGGYASIKFDGKSSQAVSNIPIFRKSEMSLIIAECYARENSIAKAQSYLYFTAKRDKDITSSDELPDNTADLLSFISEERIREFFVEGHRFFDARRMGDLVSADNYSNWDIQKFVFPIPANEINTGSGCVQNANWSDNLPR
jgi:hypothetical protein